MTIITNKHGDIMAITSKEHLRGLMAKKEKIENNLKMAKHMTKCVVKYLEKSLKSVDAEIEQIGVAL
jgi:exosome complex RNA-binding protein Rrp42 (RNase PH superfamily)